MSAPVIKCKKTPRKKCNFMAEEAKKDRLPIGRKKGPERESGNERSTVDGYPKRQTKRAELCGVGTEVPHESANSKAVRGIAAEAGVYIKRSRTLSISALSATVKHSPRLFPNCKSLTRKPLSGRKKLWQTGQRTMRKRRLT